MKKLGLISASIFMAIASILLSNHTAQAGIDTVPAVDVSRYAGRWYRISGNPLPFEKDCVCTQQTLGAIPGSVDISVYNSCNTATPTGALKEISGTARSLDVTNAKFEVDFGLPHKGEYWIIALGNAYEYAVVTDSRGDSLYILSKTPTLDPKLYLEASEKAALQVDTSKLEITNQTGCTYP